MKYASFYNAISYKGKNKLLYDPVMYELCIIGFDNTSISHKCYY